MEARFQENFTAMDSEALSQFLKFLIFLQPRSKDLKIFFQDKISEFMLFISIYITLIPFRNKLSEKGTE